MGPYGLFSPQNSEHCLAQFFEMNLILMDDISGEMMQKD
jgi:hypothetical protein